MQTSSLESTRPSEQRSGLLGFVTGLFVPRIQAQASSSSQPLDNLAVSESNEEQSLEAIQLKSADAKKQSQEALEKKLAAQKKSENASNNLKAAQELVESRKAAAQSAREESDTSDKLAKEAEAKAKLDQEKSEEDTAKLDTATLLDEEANEELQAATTSLNESVARFEHLQQELSSAISVQSMASEDLHDAENRLQVVQELYNQEVEETQQLARDLYDDLPALEYVGPVNDEPGYDIVQEQGNNQVTQVVTALSFDDAIYSDSADEGDNEIADLNIYVGDHNALRTPAPYPNTQSQLLLMNGGNGDGNGGDDEGTETDETPPVLNSVIATFAVQTNQVNQTIPPVEYNYYEPFAAVLAQLAGRVAASADHHNEPGLWYTQGSI